jgi:hypothetical protein
MRAVENMQDWNAPAANCYYIYVMIGAASLRICCWEKLVIIAAKRLT